MASTIDTAVVQLPITRDWLIKYRREIESIQTEDTDEGYETRRMKSAVSDLLDDAEDYIEEAVFILLRFQQNGTIDG